jgi:ATP-dependent DNA helicase RecQ
MSADGITLYSSADMAWAFRRIETREAPDAVRQVQARKVRQLYGLLDGAACRAAGVRRYFGEEAVEPCGQCDLCLRPPVTTDATEAAQKALSAVHRLGGRFGRGRIVDHLLGKTKEPSDFEAGLTTFGVGGELSAIAWRNLIDQLLFEGLLREDANDGRPLIGLGDAEAVREVYRGARRVGMRKPPEGAEAGARPGRTRKRTRDVLAAMGAEDHPVFERLRAWRKGEASRQAVPPYVIFHDRTLQEIAQRRPSSFAELARINGVGEGKLDRYGEAVLACLSGDAEFPTPG